MNINQTWEVTCAVCGKEFTARAMNAKFCSKECRDIKYGRKHKKPFKPVHWLTDPLDIQLEPQAVDYRNVNHCPIR